MSFLQDYHLWFLDFIYDSQNSYSSHFISGTQAFKVDSVSYKLADMEIFEDIVLQNPAGCYFAGGFYQLRRLLISFSPDSRLELRPEETWSHWFSGGKCHH